MAAHGQKLMGFACSWLMGATILGLGYFSPSCITVPPPKCLVCTLLPSFKVVAFGGDRVSEVLQAMTLIMVLS